MQAWTTADVSPDTCAGGESSFCSAWSDLTNVTTQAAGEVWHVSAGGSYLYGDGSARNPYPMDIQGLIDRPDVVNGHQIKLHPGTYGTALLRGPYRNPNPNPSPSHKPKPKPNPNPKPNPEPEPEPEPEPN